MGRYPYSNGVVFQHYKRKAEIPTFDQRLSVTAINDLLKFAGISAFDSDLYDAILNECKKYIG